MNDGNINNLDACSADHVLQQLRACCGASAWCQAMLSMRPFGNPTRVHQCADAAFDSLTEADWIEAFGCHPKIGDLKSLQLKFAGNRQWSGSEQSGTAAADQRTIAELAKRNRDYESRFGYIFIVCATGKSAKQMLDLLIARLPNDRQTELRIAAAEQRKISHLRIDKLLHTESPAEFQ